VYILLFVNDAHFACFVSLVQCLWLVATSYKFNSFILFFSTKYASSHCGHVVKEIIVITV